MWVVVLNGSPKGDDSVTIHSVKYLQKKYDEHDFNILHIAKRIEALRENAGPLTQSSRKSLLQTVFCGPIRYTF